MGYDDTSEYPRGHAAQEGPGLTVISDVPGSKVKVSAIYVDSAATAVVQNHDGSQVYFECSQGTYPGFTAYDGLSIEVPTSGNVFVYYWEA